MTRASSAASTEKLDGVIQEALNASYHDGTGAWNSTAVKWWIKFNYARGEDPFMVHGPDASMVTKLEEETRLMRFIVWLACEKKPKPVEVDTASAYASTVQGWLARNFGVKLGAGMQLHRVAQLAKGLHRLRGGKPPKKLRKALTPEKLRRAFDVALDPKKPLHANVRAMLAFMLQGLLRGAEAGMSDKAKVWRPEREFTRDDVAFFRGGVQGVIAQEKDENTLGAKTTPVVIGAGGVLIDAVEEMRNLWRVDPVAKSKAASTPCFRDPRTGKAFRVADIGAWVKRIMSAIGEDPSEYGSHSVRIGGATAMYKAGMAPLDIRVAGRWDSDCYLIYIHADRQRAMANTAMLASTTCSPTEDPFLEIGVDERDVEIEFE